MLHVLQFSALSLSINPPHSPPFFLLFSSLPLPAATIHPQLLPVSLLQTSPSCFVFVSLSILKNPKCYFQLPTMHVTVSSQRKGWFSVSSHIIVCILCFDQGGKKVYKSFEISEKKKKSIFHLWADNFIRLNGNPSRHAAYPICDRFSEFFILNGTSWIGLFRLILCQNHPFRYITNIYGPLSLVKFPAQTHHRGQYTCSIGNLDSEEEISLFVHLTCIKWLCTYWALHI